LRDIHACKVCVGTLKSPVTTCRDWRQGWSTLTNIDVATFFVIEKKLIILQYPSTGNLAATSAPAVAILKRSGPKGIGVVVNVNCKIL